MDTYEKTVVNMLNMLGDKSSVCSSNKNGCDGCDADTFAAWEEGLTALGYSPTRQGWRQMMRDNYDYFPSDEEIEDNIKKLEEERNSQDDNC